MSENLRIELFDKQTEGFYSRSRILGYVGGIQSGKTTLGGVKMRTDIDRFRKPDDSFIIAAPDYKTLNQATLPKFLKFTKGMGRYNKADAEFKVHDGGTVYMRTGTHPESLEGISNVRSVWGDEAGRFSRYFWENLEGRSARTQCPIYLTTTPYALNWISDMHRDWKNGKRDDVHFVQLRSIDSPYFPKEEYDRQKKLLDPRRFRMKYMGVFGKMEGLVYPDIPKTPSFELPVGTKYFAGVDWGYVDPFVIVIRAVTPRGMQFRVAEYYKSFLTIDEMVAAAKARHKLYGIKMFVCDPSQPGYIEAFNRAGIPATPGNNDISLGISKHQSLIRQGLFEVFEDMNPLGIDEYETYHFPEEKELGTDDSRRKRDITPVDASNHGTDCDRYLSMYLDDTVKKRTPTRPQSDQPPNDQQKRLNWLKKGGSSRYR